MANEIISMLSREDLLLLYPVGRIIESAVAINLTDLTTLFPGTEWIELSTLTDGKDCFTANYGEVSGTEPSNLIKSDGSLDTTKLVFKGSNNAIVVSHSHTVSINSEGSHCHRLAQTSYNVWQETCGPLNYRDTSRGNRCIGVAGPIVDNSIAGNVDYQKVDIENHQLVENAGSHSHTGTIASTGSAGASANMPNYLAVHKYIRVK